MLIPIEGKSKTAVSTKKFFISAISALGISIFLKNSIFCFGKIYFEPKVNSTAFLTPISFNLFKLSSVVFSSMLFKIALSNNPISFKPSMAGMRESSFNPSTRKGYSTISETNSHSFIRASE